jgi:cation diffusion facilitator CzcD-associated flavoprotein CzcO
MSLLLLKRRVAVIGGGPAGLIAFKRLVDAGVSPILFSKHIGGMWKVKSNPFWPAMRTNLSKHTCRFSDLHWPEKAPVFPSQGDIDSYLTTFAKKHIRPDKAVLGCEVTHVTTCEDGKFLVKWKDSNDTAMSGIFDDVVVTTGFFTKPTCQEFPGFKGRILHSSQYTDPNEFVGRNVVVAGASFSSSEIAADVATTAKSVRNVVSRPSWIIPRFLPMHDKPNTPFLPIDMLFYQLIPNKDSVEGRNEVLFREDADRNRTNTYMSKILGPRGNDVMAEVINIHKSVYFLSGTLLYLILCHMTILS